MKEPRENVHSNFGGECTAEDIAPYVLMPTDARHVEMLASIWQQARKITRHYEFLIYTGEYYGVKDLSLLNRHWRVSTATAVEELTRLGAHTFINIGLANPVLGEIPLGDLAIATGAVRYDSSSHGYVRPEYPALAHHEVVMAAVAAAEHHQLPYHVGVVASFASSGSPQTTGIRHYLTNRTKAWREDCEQAGVLGGSGEEATLFVQSAIYGKRAGAIIVCPLDSTNGNVDTRVEEKTIRVGLDAMFALATWDREKAVQNVPYIVPS